MVPSTRGYRSSERIFGQSGATGRRVAGTQYVLQTLDEHHAHGLASALTAYAEALLRPPTPRLMCLRAKVTA